MIERTRLADFPTVGELARFGVLASTETIAVGAADAVVRRVALASDVDRVRQCAPGTAVVLHPSAAAGGWALESALRVAWERNASCVLTTASAVSAPAPGRLASRLRLWLFAAPGDPADIALELAAQVAQPAVARFRLAARCADLISGQGSPRGIIGALNSELVGVEVALTGPDGVLLAGRRAAQAAANVVRVAVPGPDGRAWAELVAGFGGSASPAWRDTVTTILHIARAPLALCRARDRLAVRQRLARHQLALAGLLGAAAEPAGADVSVPAEALAPPASGTIAQTMPAAIPTLIDGTTEPVEPGPAPASANGRLEQALAAARALDWPVEPPFVGVCLRIGRQSQDGHMLLLDRWAELDALHPLIPHAGGFVSWWSGPGTDPAGTAKAVRALLAKLPAELRAVAGVGALAAAAADLSATCLQAKLAAAAAVSSPGRSLCRFDELGVNAVLSAVSLPDVAAIARVSLPGLDQAPDRLALIHTGRAVLDAGGSVAVAAKVLGVHRNTVHLRLERLRAKGIDLSDEHARLALHLALTALSAESTTG